MAGSPGAWTPAEQAVNEPGIPPVPWAASRTYLALARISAQLLHLWKEKLFECSGLPD